jgi:hypothetical protein
MSLASLGPSGSLHDADDAHPCCVVSHTLSQSLLTYHTSSAWVLCINFIQYDNKAAPLDHVIQQQTTSSASNTAHSTQLTRPGCQLD